MITINVKDDKIVISGHAQYGDYGKDIVCASVSSIAITTVNAIMRIDDKAILCDSREGYLEIKILKHNRVVDLLIENMLSLFSELQRDYKKNLKINRGGVL